MHSRCSELLGFVNALVPQILCVHYISEVIFAHPLLASLLLLLVNTLAEDSFLCDISDYLRWCSLVSYNLREFLPHAFVAVLNVSAHVVFAEMKVVQCSPSGARGVNFLCDRRIKLAKGPSVIARWLWLRCVFSATSAAIRNARVGSVGQRASS